VSASFDQRAHHCIRGRVTTGFIAKIAPELSIVMACLNEAETLGTCIRKAQNALAELTITGELVIADSGSSDGSQEIARCFGTQVVNKVKVLTQAA
jgi:glycosyltransferase involved in cell wall biosynthesis